MFNPCFWVELMDHDKWRRCIRFIDLIQPLSDERQLFWRYRHFNCFMWSKFSMRFKKFWFNHSDRTWVYSSNDSIWRKPGDLKDYLRTNVRWKYFFEFSLIIWGVTFMLKIQHFVQSWCLVKSQLSAPFLQPLYVNSRKYESFYIILKTRDTLLPWILWNFIILVQCWIIAGYIHLELLDMILI